ncbi:OmpA family protein [Haliangium sp.]|uniref:OmpA family protein n=1 Tax=Haliangium sp. TaxID=2663208 RepID=UPI003D0AA11E
MHDRLTPTPISRPAAPRLDNHDCASGAATSTSASEQARRPLHRGWRPAAVLGLACLGVLVAGPVSAQEMSTDIPLERFRLSADGEGVLDLEWGKVPEHLAWDLALWFDFADDPLVVYRETGGERERVGDVVDRRLTASVIGSVALWNRVQLGVEVPVVLSQTGEDLPGFMLAEPSSSGLGDIRLMPKIQILDASDMGIDLAIMPSLTLPTGSGSAYGNEPGLAFTPEIIATRAFGAVRLASSVGYLARKNANLVNLDVEDELFVRLGAGYRLSENQGPPLEIDVSVSGATAAASPFEFHNQNHAELRAGASYRLSGPLVGVVAGGLGVREGFGTPDWRGVVGVRWSPERHPGDRDGDGLLDAVDACPESPEDIDAFEDEDGCPDLDNDRDGIVDVDDGAPNDPEDVDGFEDSDGVPDLDNDKDGLLDDADQCPNEAETINSFEDEDGCPDLIPDSDGDGIADADDACPNDAEDMDAFEDEDGCPDPDNDGDGVLDVNDKCPSVAGPVANRGCPDTDRDGDGVIDRLDNCPDEPGPSANQGCTKKQDVVIGEGTITLRGKVYFPNNQARILPRSFPLLRNMATVLETHSEIAKVRVEGHTDDRGDDGYNQELSQRRAEAVMAFLVEQGVAAERLEAVGMGETRPIAPNTTAAGRAKNRRVEFIILDEAGNPTQRLEE